MLMTTRFLSQCGRNNVLCRTMLRRAMATETAAAKSETADNVVSMPDTTKDEKVYPAKIVSLVDSISQLTLLEVSELNSLLKSRLNISDAPMMAMAANVQTQSKPAEEEEEQAPATIQTAFSLRLESFDASKKVVLIKELKAQVEDMNLVQAKKFVESAPAVVKADISKEEAETLKKKLEEAGATCVIE